MMVSLRPDGKQFVTSTEDGAVKMWDVRTGEQLIRFDGLYAAYSPDGEQLAVVTPERIVKIIEVTTGKESQISNQIDARLTLAFSPDGSRLGTVASNNTPKVWDTRTGKELVAFPGHVDFVGSRQNGPV